MAERGRGKTTGPPTTTARGGPRPATPLTSTFGFEPTIPSQTQRNYPDPPPVNTDDTHKGNGEDEEDEDEEDDEPPPPEPSGSTKEKEVPPGATKIREGVYEIGLNRYIDSTIPALVRDEARELRQNYLQARITTEGLTKRDQKLLLLDTTEAIQEQLAIMQSCVGELTAFTALEQAYEDLQKQREYQVDLYRTSQRPSRANSQVRTPASSRAPSPPYLRVGSPTVLSTFQPGRGGGGSPSGTKNLTTQSNPKNIARFQLGTWSEPLQRFNISLHAGDGPTNSPKVAKPEKYDGLKKGSEAERFIDQTENYFHFKAHEFRSDTDCVAWTMQYLTGNAYNWFAPYWKKRNNILSRPEEITRWAAFRKSFFITFGEYHQKEKAEEKIKQLKQRADASRYTSDFNNLRLMINWNLEALKSHYIQGLKPDVIKFASTQPWPDSLEGIQEQAIRIDDVLFQAKNREREVQAPPRIPRPNPVNRPFQARPTNPFTPRTTAAQKAPPRGKLTTAEREERKKLGLCNYCGKPGHFAQQCPNAPKRLEARAAEITSNDDESTIEPFETPGNSQSQ